MDKDGTPSFSRGPHWRWISAFGWLAGNERKACRSDSLPRTRMRTFVDHPESATNGGRSAVEVDVQGVRIAEIIVSLLEIGALCTSLIVTALQIEASTGTML